MLKKKSLKVYLIETAIIGIVIIFGFTGYYLFVAKSQAAKSNGIAPVVIEKSCSRTNPLDGICLDGKETPVNFSVMIENYPESRPTAGLANASLVYEAIVEAPITRFLAIFSTTETVSKIGPVRSARPFYVDWAKEFDFPYLHVGGSNDALDLLNKSYDFDLNEFYNGQYFWRDRGRVAPHNVYTSSTTVKEAIADKKWDIIDLTQGWSFKADEKKELRPLSQVIKIDYANYEFNISWQYDQAKNDYVRILKDRVVTDENGDEIHARNVAIMYTESKVIDSYGRRSTKTEGEGKAIIFRDGIAVTGTWKRVDQNSRTRFFDELGKEIQFNVGVTWIEVIPTHFPEVTY